MVSIGIFLAGVFVLAVAAGLFFFKNQNSGSEIQIIASTDKVAPGQIIVHVDGSVKKPGVYKLADQSRVVDAVGAAGGLTEDADQSKVNLASKLVDGQKIYIRSVGEGDGRIVGETTGVSVSSLVNINTASEAELDKLPGIGPVTAAKIIASRPYGSLEELLTKKVVSKSVFEKIKGLITY
ncbi:hypothetical protein A2697_02880 [Candidatus Curtissbacteria bacterium RIFCSPHIGHO2_01_FULL_41_44]|uniref:Helix-hairpin-helix DNA-binding motif class 1 domain-containing protein n=1 Tax=Candidatus Curtissbacteria bacterium RIFCSPLOWO2_01_FULL_42_50 TaxID=1797730 RepID=A0A1F5H7Y4_9BACT|nr:MAG: hypothetical protein A2697_02880 [Candidatus Curtissbacteria bacterium RIFCSPHIGHO2_01_FULL_41_44]OGD93037.1 MAG: hypothetical protein A3C33_01060 [Candidatus Curtissbacteria bacterium RIFCSPHIGHO2_02_FULL_42_58]OGD97051.1 MAG: hypothetical protein A3E71_02350 [Candidatus Curtissbacteria bacterium RIFCSPHIGHO2_12_FULL_42_33]OGE00273.1 MAG: hypothetical protein A3B54_00825 [Candidatus Curtissbacteria bacterium RIFCSPLOWO2_01_FULL_42_50]OGE03070.1 MAG: hypothetical protein A3G16_04215 [Ca